jgi:translation initiation factor IF-2
MRLSQVARKLNVGITTIVDFLNNRGFDIDGKPNTKITDDQFRLLLGEFQGSALAKEEAAELTIGAKAENLVIDSDKRVKSSKESEEVIQVKNLGSQGSIVEAKKEEPKVEETPKEVEAPKAEPTVERAPESDNKLQGIKVLGKIDLNPKKEEPKVEEKPKVVEPPKVEKPVKVEPERAPESDTKLKGIKVLGKIDLAPKKAKQVEPKKEEVKKEEPKAVAPQPDKVAATEPEKISSKADKLVGLKVLGKIELPKERKPKPVTSSDAHADSKGKRKRKRIEKPAEVRKTGARLPFKKGGKTAAPAEKGEISATQIKDKIKATMARMEQGKSKTSRSKYKRERRKDHAEAREEEMMQAEEGSKTLKVTEFVSASEIASLMDISVNDVISACMGLGMFVSINQRLDAETIQVIADEFGYEVEFTTSDDDEAEEEIQSDAPEDLIERAPVVTIMGHVDHGKTSLLDYIRKSKVADGEAGGITQHVGAYKVTTDSGKDIAFLDTPGHEAFTAMRARGAKLTDIVILVVAADDDVMPQTKEAIKHAQLAGVPLIVALNKMDKDGANPDKVKEQLAQENVLVEDWGGKYQCQHVSAKTGEGIEDLLEKVLIESEVLELKANPGKSAVGSVVEASLDKGRGFLNNVLVQAGTLKIGDILVAGAHHGKVKAMLDHTGKRLQKATPSTPVQVLGLAGAAQAGDKFFIAENEKEAKAYTNKRSQILREQSVRTKKHLTLDEIGRRLAVGSFKELNLIIKGDVDGSVEALTDSLMKLSNEEIVVNVIHKAVGQITESDILLATASDAIILGFQVRPSLSAKKLAEEEEIEIKLYSIIYRAIDDIRDALEGMLEPDSEEVIVGNVEIRETFKISKIGTIAGCYVLDGYIKRENPIRIIRDGIVKYEGEMGALKRYKDDVAEVKFGYECGLSVKGYNDILEGDIVESYEIRTIKKKLK